MPKTRKPVADYITFEQYQKMLKAEKDPRMRLLFRFIWTFMLRVSEAVGQSSSDVHQLKRYRRENKSDKTKLKWTGPIPGLRPCDIDAVSPADAGLECKHTLRIYRKMGKFEIFPFNDEKLYDDTMKVIPQWGVTPDDRLFPYARQRVMDAMNLHGMTVGGQTKIHAHSLRRGGGVHMRNAGKMQLEDLQAVYSHTNLGQTLAYIGIDKRVALNAFARAQKA